MKIEITYCSNYNGCCITATIDGKEVGEDDPTYGKKIEAAQNAIIEEAYKDVIKTGRHEGEYNGDIDDLEEFAINTVREQFGYDVEITFEEDSSST